MPRAELGEIRLEPASCPRCGQDRSTPVAGGRDFLHHLGGHYGAAACQACGLWFQNPRPAPDSLAALYPGDYQPHGKPEPAAFNAATARVLAHSFGYPELPVTKDAAGNWRHHRIFDFIRKRRADIELCPEFIPEGKLLEIGCASGARLLLLRQLGWRHLHGIELAPAAAAQAAAAGFAVSCGQAEEILGTFPDDCFEVIIASMVLEHLYNPFQLVREIAKKLRPGGQFLFSTVVRDSLDFRLYGDYWAGFDFPRHMVYFRKADIEEMLAGRFEKVKCFQQNAPIDFIRSSGWRQADGHGRLVDRLVLSWGASKLAKLATGFLAWLGWATRVSYRCKKVRAG